MNNKSETISTNTSIWLMENKGDLKQVKYHNHIFVSSLRYTEITLYYIFVLLPIIFDIINRGNLFSLQHTQKCFLEKKKSTQNVPKYVNFCRWKRRKREKENVLNANWLNRWRFSFIYYQNKYYYCFFFLVFISWFKNW